jgi:hypothetical protein
MFNPSTIDEFKSAVGKGNGFARTNLYSVMLPSFGNLETSRNLSLFCSNVTLPSRQLSTVERRINTDLDQVAYGYVNPNISMTFRIMNNQSVRTYFENWQSRALGAVSDTDGEYVSAYPDDYVQPIHIYQLRKGTALPLYTRDFGINRGPINLNFTLDLDIGTKGVATYHWILERAYPVSITYETLSDNSKDEISEVSIEFAYRRWKGEELNTKTLGDTTAGKVLRVLNKIF